MPVRWGLMRISRKPFEEYGRERTEFLEHFGFLSVPKPKDLISAISRKTGSV
ncbi:MAG: hypothetical protein V1702_03900 [Candidatus Woesearchaeota archaeon]